jgi:hypothetical protein
MVCFYGAPDTWCSYYIILLMPIKQCLLFAQIIAAVWNYLPFSFLFYTACLLDLSNMPFVLSFFFFFFPFSTWNCYSDSDVVAD